MWILPKSLISAFAQDTEALTLDSGECSQACAQSLMRRSKPSPAKIYLREWKAGNLMRLRSGAISSLSLGRAFEVWWTSSLAATRASHSVQPASEQVQMTQDTSGRLSQPELLQCDQLSVSLKTSRDISRWGCPTSSKTCQECGSTNLVGIHHKDRNPLNNSNENLVTLCASCHTKLHWKEGKKPWKERQSCKVCGKPAKGHGLCLMHYQRWKKYGDPLLTKRFGRRGAMSKQPVKEIAQTNCAFLATE